MIFYPLLDKCVAVFIDNMDAYYETHERLKDNVGKLEGELVKTSY